MAASAGAGEGSVFLIYEYDVFCSFSDRDAKVFTNEICKTLMSKRFRVFRKKSNDDDLKGEEEEDVKPKLRKALQVSKITIIFFSKNYISSKSCLDELVMILQSKKIFGHLFLPMFWDVDPAELEQQTGNVSETFARFREDGEKENKIKEWGEALREATKFEGLVLKKQDDDNKVESSCIQKIIEMTEDKLKMVGSQVVSGIVNNFISRATFIEKVVAAGIAEVGLLKDQEGEGSSSNEVLDNSWFLNPVNSFFERIADMTDIPLSELESMYAVRALDLSNRSIESLPDTISSLVELRQLLLRGDKILMELPASIGALKNLEVLDLEGTELICLPEEIGDLVQLECLKVSLYKCADSYIRRKKIKAIIPRGALSKLSHLKELSIHVDPDCEWWDVEARTIINELSDLRNLEILKLYLPTDELLQQFLQLPRNVYKSLSNFRLIVGRHESDIVICLPDDLQSEYEKSEKCLKYVNGEGNTDVVGKALKHAKALFLDRQWTFEKLSVFKIQEMTLLVCCLIVECNMMETIIDGSDFYEEGDNATANDRKPALELLRYLSVHHMKNLQCIWKGPIVTGCLSSLEILALHTCPELITIFNPALLRNLVNLKELIVKDCPKIQSLVTVEPGLLEADHAFLPSLQTILLVHLPELLSISSGLIIPQKLQKIVVYNCPKLDNLSPEDKYSKYMHKVKDESQCSKALDLSSNETDYLHHVFVHLMDQLKQSGNSLNQPSLENQAARTEGIFINKDMLKEGKTKQGNSL
ncbi:hypothetical protein LguiB_006257 [Lonicera macranthoides]